MPSFNLKFVLELLVRDIDLIQRIISFLEEDRENPIFRRAFVQLVMDIGERVNLFRDIDLDELHNRFSDLDEVIQQVRLFDQNPEVNRSIANFRNIGPTAEALFNEIFQYFQNNIGDFLEQAVHPLLERLSEEEPERIQIPFHREGYAWQDFEWPVIRILAWCRNKLEHFYMYESNAFIIQEERSGIREKRGSDCSEKLTIEDIFQCISAEVEEWERIFNMEPGTLPQIEGINSAQLKLLALRNCYITVIKMWADCFSKDSRLQSKIRSVIRGSRLNRIVQRNIRKELGDISNIRTQLMHSYSSRVSPLPEDPEAQLQELEKRLKLHKKIQSSLIVKFLQESLDSEQLTRKRRLGGT